MGRASKEIYFQSEDQKKKYERYAKDLGFDSFSSFVRFCINFTVKNISMNKRLGELESKLDLVLDRLSQFSESQSMVIQKQESFIKSIEEISYELQKTYTNKEKLELIERSLAIVGDKYPKWVSFKELVEALEIEEEPRLIELLREIVMEPNKLFDNYVERKGDKFRARQEPKYEELSGLYEVKE